MKTEIIANPILQSASLDSSTNTLMSMDASGIGMATLFLRDKIYSNKIGAVVREYTGNASDEHTKHNIDVPVRIELSAETFSVRDYALGLDDFGVRNIFGMYFKSTKSSDNSLIGGFGIGSKSGHCYTDTFYVKSFHNGICTLYACALGGKEGVPVGQIIEIDKSETTETGLEVFMDVANTTDFYTFEREIESLIETSNKQIEAYINYSGISDRSPCKITPKIPIYEKQVGDYSFRVFDTVGPSSVIFKMGNIRYKTPSNVSPGHYIPSSSGTTFIGDQLVVVDIPIGKLSLPISRETFESTPANAAVFEEIRKVFAELEVEERETLQKLDFKQVKQFYKDAPSNYGVKILKGNLFSFEFRKLFPDYVNVFQSLKSTYDFKHEQIDGKEVVVLIPDNRNAPNWIDRLKDTSFDKQKAFLYCSEGMYQKFLEKMPSDMEEHYISKPIRDKFVGIPPLVREKSTGNKYYNVYLTSGYGRRATKAYKDCSPIEVHNQLCNKKFEHPSEVKDHIEKIKANSVSTNYLDDIAITLVKSGETPPQGIWTHSIKMFNAMLELGWFNADSEEYKKVREECAKRIDEMNILRKLKSLDNHKILPPKTASKLTIFMDKKTSNITRVKKVLDNLKSEDSLRGVVWRALNNAGVSLDRKNVRAILKLTTA